MAKQYSTNNPISGQRFTFTSKADADAYAAEVYAATGYTPQIVSSGADDPAPVAQVSDPAAGGAPKGAEVNPAADAASASEPPATDPASEPPATDPAGTPGA